MAQDLFINDSSSNSFKEKLEIFVRADLWEIFYNMESFQKTKTSCYSFMFKCCFSKTTAKQSHLEHSMLCV